jgi:hypothetical protein
LPEFAGVLIAARWNWDLLATSWLLHEKHHGGDSAHGQPRRTTEVTVSLTEAEITSDH